MYTTGNSAQKKKEQKHLRLYEHCGKEQIQMNSNLQKVKYNGMIFKKINKIITVFAINSFKKNCIADIRRFMEPFIPCPHLSLITVGIQLMGT